MPSKYTPKKKRRKAIVKDSWSVRMERLRSAPERVERVLLPIGNRIRELANPMVPRDTGQLVRSGRVVAEDKDEVSVSYGRSSAPYALYAYYTKRYKPRTGQREWLHPDKLSVAASVNRARVEVMR